MYNGPLHTSIYTTSRELFQSSKKHRERSDRIEEHDMSFLRNNTSMTVVSGYVCTENLIQSLKKPLAIGCIAFKKYARGDLKDGDCRNSLR